MRNSSTRDSTSFFTWWVQSVLFLTKNHGLMVPRYVSASTHAINVKVGISIQFLQSTVTKSQFKRHQHNAHDKPRKQDMKILKLMSAYYLYIYLFIYFLERKKEKSSSFLLMTFTVDSLFVYSNNLRMILGNDFIEGNELGIMSGRMDGCVTVIG